ncbi:hypothetical protein FH972_024815 [Carpinus fangiana]|uniref:Uncharacterized protein n=1 Tax=Carpinus fangiana TaxID=176857 RepID=A0A5N6KZT3_9ROSI|nr:hypothetical protein FH972_024815 [Carpinus fangiana]
MVLSLTNGPMYGKQTAIGKLLECRPLHHIKEGSVKRILGRKGIPLNQPPSLLKLQFHILSLLGTLALLATIL